MNNSIIPSIVNSLLVGIYLLMTIGVDLVSMSRYVTFMEIGLYIMPFMLIVYGLHFSLLSVIIFAGASLFCLLKGFIYLPLVYLISAPILAQFVVARKFNIFILYIIWGLIILVFFNAALKDDLDSFMLCSRNYVSIKLLFVSTLITIIVYRQSKKIIIWPALITLILSLMAIGRGGILCSSINFIGLLYLKLLYNSRLGFKLLFVTLLISLVVFYWPQIEEIYEASDQLERLRDEGFEDSSREDIWGEYLSRLDMTTIITGVNIYECPLIHSFNNNPHNSYLLLHAYLGIFALIPYCLILYALYVNISRKDYVYVLPLIALLIRCFTDIALLHYYDFIILLFVFRSFELKKDKYAGITSLTSQS